MRIERLCAGYELTLRWVHFPLHPETPPEGRTLEELFAGRGFDLAAMKQRLHQFAATEGLPMGERDSTYNSRLAQEMAMWAETREGGEKIHDALFRAYFVDGVNIARPELLVKIASGIGLPEDEAGRILAERSFSDAVDRDWQRSRSLGVTGVPTFVAGGQGVVGAQPYEALKQLVVEAGAGLRASPRRS